MSLIFNYSNNKIFHTVEQTITAYKMFRHGDSVLVGVSGGPDSVALLCMLLHFASKFSLRLGIAHLNHCLREKDSDNDAEFVGSLARKVNLPYYIGTEDVRKYQHKNKLSLEEAARRVRYAFYENVAEKNRFSKIALGHHADDNAELVLMYLLRGSGPLGLSGIPPVRDNKFVRPLIRLTRSEIIDFLSASGLKYVSDASNEDTRYLRNRIRHHLIPTLKASYNPQITETLNRLSSIIRDENEWIENVTDPVFKNCISDVEEEKIVLSVAELKKIHIAGQRRIIRKAIARVKGNLRRVTYIHIKTILNLLQNGPAFGSLDLPDRIRTERKGERLFFSRVERATFRAQRSKQKKHVSCPSFEYNIFRPGIIFIKEIGARFKFSQISRENMPVSSFKSQVSDFESQVSSYFDMDILNFPMIIRNCRPGDRFAPLGMGGQQKVKKYFINNKVSREERANCPILLCQEKIIWVVGHRMDEFAKVTPSTQNILKVELFLA
ncbi:tRNA lysidine(34) synthetase TilS [Desulfonema magnum]|uniref:tRNA(Ile)-lysidine synthase n=1 Tax=Desulfonema magnum TaxID=45655 RepID=A0A975GRZ5_9BACT|nr:tRNA lysidine(34) synthetase TilS [Desulfonema magnum]QTA90538.1 tRNA(Ile)-lysidine synthase [Desulfonema magnum]